MKTITTLTTGLAAALAAGALVASPAVAETLPTVKVAYGDLDLSTKKGQQALERRLKSAAREVCGIEPRTQGFALPSSEARGCYRETVESFEREIAIRAGQQQQRG